MRTIHISEKRKNSDKYHKSSFSCMQCAVSCSSSLKLFFFMPTHEKETQLGNYVLCAKSAFVCKSHRVLPESSTTARGLIVGFFDLKHMSMNHYPVPLSAADTISSAGPSPPPPHPQRGCDKPIFSRQFGPRSGPTKCLMFCSRNKGADKTVRCAQPDLRM